MANGFQGTIGIGKETTWGTGVAASRFYNAKESITEDRGRLREDFLFGSRSVTKADSGRLHIGGGITEVHARPAGLGELLRAGFGAPTTTGAASPYTHVFKPTVTEFSSVAPLPPYSATVKRGGQVLRYLGGQLTKLDLKQPKDGILSVGTDWMFRDVETTTAPTSVFEQAERFRFKHLAVTRNAIAYPYVEDLSISIDNALEAEEIFDQSDLVAAFVFNGSLKVEVGMTLTFRDLATYADFRDNVAQAWGFTWTINANASLAIAVPSLSIEKWSAPISGPGRLTIGVTGIAQFDSTAGYEFQATLVNGQASY